MRKVNKNVTKTFRMYSQKYNERVILQKYPFFQSYSKIKIIGYVLQEAKCKNLFNQRAQ